MTLRTIRLLFYFELLLLLRRSQEWLYPLAFFILVVSLFPLTFAPDPKVLQTFIPGYIWLAALFANLLAIDTIFFDEIEDGHLEQLFLSPIPLTLLIVIKLCVKWLVAELPLIILTPLLGWIFNLSIFVIIALCMSLLLGTPVLMLLSSLCVALTLGLRQQGVLLGLLILPLITPVLIVGVACIQQYQAGFSIVGPLAFLAGLSMFAMTLLPWVIATTLRISSHF
ncbi:MAG: heme exporter protein CcmB [Gammaproteobacteria bacterium RIFCSPHIGHO2_12_FULL_37_34]|nr:MAG: heme exporter protein CcmB [Gammaproteobacteria bacterium RIFCSPHIGHO2_12_FULL_37_34]